MRVSAQAAVDESRKARTLTVVGKLAPDRTLSSVTAWLGTVSRRQDAAASSMKTAEASTQPPPRQWRARSAAEAWRNPSTNRAGIVMIGLASLVLVLACANLANLTFARSALREREFAMCRALGASRWRVVRAQCVESSILAALGTVAALVVARALVWLLLEFAPLSYDVRVTIEPQLRTHARVFAATLLLVCLFLFGVEPALRATPTHNVTVYLLTAHPHV